MTFLVHAVGHVKIAVLDMAAAIRDATEILGLHVTRADDRQAWLSSNGRAAELVLLRASENAAHTIGLEALSEDAVREVESRVEAAGCRILSREPSLACVKAAITLATPEGLRFEVHTPIRDEPGRRRHPVLGVGPSRLDHMNVLTPDPVATRRQLERMMGLRLSERLVDDSLVWMHGGNRQHHILGLVKGSGPGLHHYSFELSAFSDYLRLGDILDRHGKQMVWGPGRHRPGDNTYAYYLDAAGAMVECSGPMSTVADDERFEANVIANLARPGNVRAMNVWGTPAPLEWRTYHFPFVSLG